MLLTGIVYLEIPPKNAIINNFDYILLYTSFFYDIVVFRGR